MVNMFNNLKYSTPGHRTDKLDYDGKEYVDPQSVGSMRIGGGGVAKIEVKYILIKIYVLIKSSCRTVALWSYKVWTHTR